MQSKDFSSVVQNRRTIYAIGKDIPITKEKVQEIVEFAVKWTPSSMNSQTSRAVVLLGDHHTKLWSSLKEILRKIVPADAFAATETKVDGFAAGYAP